MKNLHEIMWELFLMDINFISTLMGNIDKIKVGVAWNLWGQKF